MSPHLRRNAAALILLAGLASLLLAAGCVALAVISVGGCVSGGGCGGQDKFIEALGTASTVFAIIGGAGVIAGVSGLLLRRLCGARSAGTALTGRAQSR